MEGGPLAALLKIIGFLCFSLDKAQIFWYNRPCCCGSILYAVVSKWS